MILQLDESIIRLTSALKSMAATPYNPTCLRQFYDLSGGYELPVLLFPLEGRRTTLVVGTQSAFDFDSNPPFVFCEGGTIASITDSEN